MLYLNTPPEHYCPVYRLYDQDLIIKHENQEISGWMMVKQNRQENTALDGQPINLECYTNAEEQRKTTQRHAANQHIINKALRRSV